MKNPYRIKTKYIDSKALNKPSTRHQRRKVERMNKNNSFKDQWSTTKEWIDLHENEAIALSTVGLLWFIAMIILLCFNFLVIGGLTYCICFYLGAKFSWKIVFLLWLLYELLFHRIRLTVKVSDL